MSLRGETREQEQLRRRMQFQVEPAPDRVEGTPRKSSRLASAGSSAGPSERTRSSREDGASRQSGKKLKMGSKEGRRGKGQEEDDGTSFNYYFGGPWGTFLCVALLPYVILVLVYWTSKEYTLQWPKGGVSAMDWLKELWAHLPPPPWRLVPQLLTSTGCGIFACWLVFQVVLERLLPGKKVEGAVLPDGQRLSYRINGHLAFWTTLLAMGHSGPVMALLGMSPLRLAVLYDHYLEVAMASIVFSFGLSLVLFGLSFREGEVLLAESGTSGNSMYDFWMGRELNPRIGSFDLKFFFELRPGLLGWAVLNIGMAMKQIELTGNISTAMLLVQIFQGVYVWDSLFQESSILTTMDITTEGFGFMLVFGDISWVPFVYSLQARYLVEHDAGLPSWAYVLIFAVHWLGYATFRSSNSQKDAFRRDPKGEDVRHLEWMPTTRGTKLLTSGWWGMARKINYTGDWIMGLCWCLCTGFNSPVTYFYAAYFLVLLVLRAQRDDAHCQDKYGADWATYKEKVPALFIPGVL